MIQPLVIVSGLQKHNLPPFTEHGLITRTQDLARKYRNKRNDLEKCHCIKSDPMEGNVIEQGISW